MHNVPINWSKKAAKKQQKKDRKDGALEKDEVLLGQYNGASCSIIMLPKKCDESFLRETLFHEVLHAIGDLQGVAWDADEETQVRALSPNIIMVMEDNPHLHRYIFGGSYG